MRITTWNVNGLRAALRKGFARHVRRVRPDVLLLQEIRAMPEQLPRPWGNPGMATVLQAVANRSTAAGVVLVFVTEMKGYWTTRAIIFAKHLTILLRQVPIFIAIHEVIMKILSPRNSIWRKSRLP